MPFTKSLVSFEASRRVNKWTYKAVPTATSYATGGDPFDFTAVTAPAGTAHPVPDYIPTADQVAFLNDIGGNGAEWVKGTTLANGKIKFWSATATELTAATYAATMQADALYFTVVQKRGISQ